VAHRIVGYVKQVEIVVKTGRVAGSGLRPSQGSGVDEEMVMSQQAMRQAA
jgi:sporulation protein YlmC with PRC-barrel domain